MSLCLFVGAEMDDVCSGGYDVAFQACRKQFCKYISTRKCNERCHEIALDCNEEEQKYHQRYYDGHVNTNGQYGADNKDRHRSDREHPHGDGGNTNYSSTDDKYDYYDVEDNAGMQGQQSTGAFQHVKSFVKKNRRAVGTTVAAYAVPAAAKASIPIVMKATGTVVKGVGTLQSAIVPIAQAVAGSPWLPIAAVVGAYYYLSDRGLATEQRGIDFSERGDIRNHDIINTGCDFVIGEQKETTFRGDYLHTTYVSGAFFQKDAT